jgi:tyrosinase
MSDQSKLNYQYDDLTPAVAAPKARVGGAAVATGKNVELVGASAGTVKVSGGEEIRTAVQLDSAMRQKVAKSLAVPAAGETAAPDRVFLNLENVRGLNDAAAFRVYVNLPEGAKPEDHPELLAGSVALFGVRTASQTDAEHAGQGLTFVLEITKIVDALHLKNGLDVNSLDVRIVPIKPIPEGAQISIGRISIYRQGN